MERIPYLGEEILRWQVGPSTFLAHPERGARLMSWYVDLPDGSTRDVIYWPDDVATFDDFHRIRGGNPILFPFCARTFDRGDIKFWRAADGIRRPMPMHGFARDGRFELQEADEHGFTARLTPKPADADAYPFDYAFDVIYRFRPLGFAVELTLANNGSIPLPWSAGHHFYFSLPWDDSLSRADYELNVPARKTQRQNERGELIEAPAPKSRETFGDPDLSDRIHTNLKSDTISFGAPKGGGRVVMRIGTQEKPSPETSVVTWTQNEASPFYCVEPWMGPPNSPETGFGLHHVAPGKKESFAVEIGLE